MCCIYIFLSSHTSKLYWPIHQYSYHQLPCIYVHVHCTLYNCQLYRWTYNIHIAVQHVWSTYINTYINFICPPNTNETWHNDRMSFIFIIFFLYTILTDAFMLSPLIKKSKFLYRSFLIKSSRVYTYLVYPLNFSLYGFKKPASPPPPHITFAYSRTYRMMKGKSVPCYNLTLL